MGYPTELTNGEIDQKYSPAKWGWCSDNAAKAYTADAPTIKGYEEKFGRKAAAAWVMIHILALYGTSNNRSKEAADSIVSFAESFAPRVAGFKLTELMLFFARYKAGCYDNSYASFDARRIGNAFFKEFCPERNQELAVIMRREEQQRIANSRFNAPMGHTSLSLYQTLRKLAETGDVEARALMADRTANSLDYENFLKRRENAIHGIYGEEGSSQARAREA